MSVERLTEKHAKKNGGYYMKCSEYCEREETMCIECERSDEIVDRLGAIEDILGDDYDLDRFRELVEADRDGRCVTLCKHDFVYDELHKKIVCQKCGYVLTAEDKRRICDKGLELLRAEEAAEAALKGEQHEKH